MIWLFKLTVTPLLIAAATLVTRRFGPRVGGLLLGFPLMGGPISVFFALEQGTPFAAAAAKGTLLAVVAVAAYCAVYGLVASYAPWSLTLLAALCAFTAIALPLPFVDIGMIGASAAAYLAIAATLAVMRPPRTVPVLGSPPAWDIWVRMATSAVLVAAVTLVAERLGPAWSGIIGAFPVITTVAICFMHQQWGHEAALVGLRGIVMSLFAFISFFVATGLMLTRYGMTTTYLSAVGAAILTSMMVLAIERRWRSQ